MAHVWLRRSHLDLTLALHEPFYGIDGNHFYSIVVSVIAIGF